MFKKSIPVLKFKQNYIRIFFFLQILRMNVTFDQSKTNYKVYSPKFKKKIELQRFLKPIYNLLNRRSNYFDYFIGTIYE